MSAVVQLPGLAREAQIIAAALEILERRHARGAALTDPDATRAYLRVRLAERPNEVIAGEELYGEPHAPASPWRDPRSLGRAGASGYRAREELDTKPHPRASCLSAMLLARTL